MIENKIIILLRTMMVLTRVQCVHKKQNDPKSHYFLFVFPGKMLSKVPR